MSETVADFVLSRLLDWGVKQVFAYPGDGINGILAAWGKADSSPQFIQARHEEMAAFEAVGYAKFSGKVGVCMATSGPGAIHLLNGLYDAKLDHVPVLAIVGQTTRRRWAAPTNKRSTWPAFSRTCAISSSRRSWFPSSCPTSSIGPSALRWRRHSPTCIIVPYDVQELDYEPPEHAFKMVPSSLGISWPHAAPDDAAIRQAAEILNAGSKVAILVGQGARGAREEITQVAEMLGAGVAKALLGKDVLSDELEWVTGVARTARHPTQLRVDDGVRHPAYRWLELPLHPVPPAARRGPGHSDRHRRQLHRYALPLRAQPGRRRQPPRCGRCCPCSSANQTVRGARPSRRTWRSWWETVERQAMTDSDREGFVNPQRLVWELSARLPANAVVAADSGSVANWYARHLKFTGDQRGSLSGTLATMGPWGALRYRGQVRPPGPPGHRSGGGRRHADERTWPSSSPSSATGRSGRIPASSWPCCTTTTSTR